MAASPYLREALDPWEVSCFRGLIQTASALSGLLSQTQLKGTFSVWILPQPSEMEAGGSSMHFVALFLWLFIKGVCSWESLEEKPKGCRVPTSGIRP